MGSVQFAPRSCTSAKDVLESFRNTSEIALPFPTECPCPFSFAVLFTQLQAVVHGGLPPLMAMATSNDPDDQRYAAMALGNIAANEGNHPKMVARGAIQALVVLSKSPEADIREYAGFTLANLASNADYLDAIGAKGGIDPLVNLAGSANVHTQVKRESWL